jgi:predicted N-acyltransferase
MFEPWQKFEAKATSLMNRHRKTLRREHEEVRKALRHKMNQTADNSERVKALRQTYIQALNDHICVCRALSRDFFVVNLLSYLDAFQAQSRLFVMCNEVALTLRQLDPT